MGTRHMVGVVKDRTWKVGQYGQWDGYPSGQGSTILDFFAAADLENFKTRIDQTQWLTDEEADQVTAEVRASNKDLCVLFPELSRDTGAGILAIIANLRDGETLKLKDTHGFAGDGLMCEYAYVIDLDTEKLEVYKGFNQDQKADFGRFANDPELEKPEGEISAKYTLVVLAATYDLASLPSVEQLETDVDPEEDE